MDFKPYRGKSGFNLSLDFEGLAAAQAGLTALPITMGLELKQALRTWAEETMERSKALVPVNTGLLRSTGQVNGPEMKDGAWLVHLGYGDGKRAWYAAIVHERLDVRHPRGQAKFLETAINENLKNLDAALAEAIRSALEKVA